MRTIGNRVTVKSRSRVRIPPSPTGKKPLLSTKAREVFLLNVSRVCTPLKKGGATVGCLPFGYDDSIIVFKEVLA